MVAKNNLRDIALGLMALGILGFFTLTETWMKSASIFVFVVGMIILLR